MKIEIIKKYSRGERATHVGYFLSFIYLFFSTFSRFFYFSCAIYCKKKKKKTKKIIFFFFTRSLIPFADDTTTTLVDIVEKTAAASAREIHLCTRAPLETLCKRRGNVPPAGGDTVSLLSPPQPSQCSPWENRVTAAATATVAASVLYYYYHYGIYRVVRRMKNQFQN